MQNIALFLFGDQLSLSLVNNFISQHPNDSLHLFMMESIHENTKVPSHLMRSTFFLSSMRHFAQEIRQNYQNINVHYYPLDQQINDIFQALPHALSQYHIHDCYFYTPNEWDLFNKLQNFQNSSTESTSYAIHFSEDPRFLATKKEFFDWATNRKELRMEYFYRLLRKKYNILMSPDGSQPLLNQWNFDHDNRSAYPKSGPGNIPEPLFFAADEITTQVITDLKKLLPLNPSSNHSFNYPVTRSDALLFLDHFIHNRLINFGQFQDAMWTDTPFGWHSILSAMLNVGLLEPLEIIHKAQQAYLNKQVSIESAEGFIRQILGWREFIRGCYWFFPTLKNDNHYHHLNPLPSWFWTGDTKMNCLKDSIKQTLNYGYAHHIQRLMIIGNFSFLASLLPQAVSEWFLSVYIDAIEWVELPNVIGMALNADNGKFTSKPYISGGSYINKQSNYCKSCPYKHSERTGVLACPFSTLYWYQIHLNQTQWGTNPRMSMIVNQWKKTDPLVQSQIIDQAKIYLADLNNL